MVKPIPSLEAIRADARKAQRRAERLAPPCDSDLYRHYDADTGLIADCEYEPGYPGSDWEPPVKEEMLVHRVYANGLEVDHLISDAVTARLAAAALEQLHDEQAEAAGGAHNPLQSQATVPSDVFQTATSGQQCFGGAETDCWKDSTKHQPRRERCTSKQSPPPQPSRCWPAAPHHPEARITPPW